MTAQSPICVCVLAALYSKNSCSPSKNKFPCVYVILDDCTVFCFSPSFFSPLFSSQAKGGKSELDDLLAAGLSGGAKK